jgi:hypothetical protein
MDISGKTTTEAVRKPDEVAESPKTSDDLTSLLFVVKILFGTSLLLLILTAKRKKSKKSD